MKEFTLSLLNKEEPSKLWDKEPGTNKRVHSIRIGGEEFRSQIREREVQEGSGKVASFRLSLEKQLMNLISFTV